MKVRPNVMMMTGLREAAVKTRDVSRKLVDWSRDRGVLGSPAARRPTCARRPQSISDASPFRMDRAGVLMFAAFWAALTWGFVPLVRLLLLKG